MAKGTLSYFSDKALFIIDSQTLDILDINERAVELYGYSRTEFFEMNVNDLGEKKRWSDLLSKKDAQKLSDDPVWLHEKKNGSPLYVQFTHHEINYEGRPARFAVAHDISDQIERKEDNSAKYPKFSGHSGHFPLARIGYNSDFVIKDWSEKAEELFGWSKEEVVRKKDVFETLLPEEEVETSKKQFRDLVADQTLQYTVEAQNVSKDGKTRYCRWYNSLAYDEEGELASVRSLVSDITDRKESQKLFRALSEESLVGVYLIQDGKFQYVNPRFADIFGYSKQEIEGKIGPIDLTHPEDRPQVKQKLTDRIEGKKGAIEYGFRCITKDDAVINVHVYGSGIEYEGAPAIVGTIVDVTRNNKIVKRYQASVESFQDLFDSISDAIYIQDKHGRFVEVNEGAERMYGYSREEFLGKTPEFLAVEDKVDIKKVRKYSQEALKGRPQQFKWWGKRKNGEKFPKEVVMNAGKYFGEDAVIVVARDVSEQYEAEEQLRRSEEKFRQLFQNAPIGIAFLNKDQKVEHLNQAFTDIFGYKTEDIKGEAIDEVIVPEEFKSEAYGVSKKIFTGTTAKTTGKRKTKSGEIIDTLIYGVPVNVEGETIAIYGLYVDVTDSKEAEEKIKKSLKEKEVLLSEIHHRVKNNLAVITGLLELQAYNSSSEEAVQVLRDSQMRINSIALIHEKLYQREDLSEISFNTYLDELTDVIVSSLRTDQTDVTINIEADPVDLTITQAIPCGLILNELITNAYKHAFKNQDEGTITILVNQDGQKVQLVVYDDGRGMPEKPDLENSDSLGVQLINTLSTQLRGTASFVNNDPGTRFELEFELDKNEANY